ncbi:MAG: glutamate racemase [Cocleimonas sp.]|nr:glutamate racemase [Cocleimonas sp.]
MYISHGDSCPIGVFDSGIGGLSVLKEIHQLLPHENLIYVGDSAHAPYGDRSAKYVRERSQAISDFLLDQGVKAIVVACNTATAEAATQLRETMDVPVIGLEPAVKPAAQLSKNGIIGVLATQRTIDSERLLGLTERYAKDKKVLAQACPGLVEQVEACELNNPETNKLLKKYIEPLLEQGADALILGCTHYPFLLPAIRKIVGSDIEILETGKPVAEQLKRILIQNDLEVGIKSGDNKTSEDKTGGNKKSTLTFYNSSNDKQHHNAMKKLWHKPIEINLLPKLD